MVIACEWQRMAPMRTQMPSTGMGRAARPRILLVSALPFHSSRLWPLPRSLSIQGIRLPASAAPKFAFGSASERSTSVTARSMSRIALPGSFSRSAATPCAAPICSSNSRMFGAPAPDAAW